MLNLNIKMAVKVTNGQSGFGTISKVEGHEEYDVCEKCHACITNSTGSVLCRSTITAISWPPLLISQLFLF